MVNGINDEYGGSDDSGIDREDGLIEETVNLTHRAPMDAVISNTNTDERLNIGHVDDLSSIDGKIKKFTRENNGDEQILLWLWKIDDYSTFIQKLKQHMAFEKPDGRLSEDDLNILDTYYSSEIVAEMKSKMSAVFRLYDYEAKTKELRTKIRELKKEVKTDDVLIEMEILEAELVEVVTSYNAGERSSINQVLSTSEHEVIDSEEKFIFPADKLLNGVFPTLDKSCITDEIVEVFNLHGLRDEEFDIYVDEDRDIMIPVYYDFGTSNAKWFEFYVYLETLFNDLGITGNPKAPLIVFDRKLMGIDARREDNTLDINRAIAAECKRNILYAVREAAAYYEKSSETINPVGMSIGDYTWLWLYAQSINSYREGPRQTGKTFISVITLGVEFGCSYTGMFGLVIHFKKAEGMKNRNNMIVAANHLPAYLKMHNIMAKTVKRKKELYVAEDMEGRARDMVTNISLGNSLKIAVIGTRESSAEQVGRGDTVTSALCDEICYWEQVRAVLTAVGYAQSTAKQLAKASGKRHGTYMISTPGKLSTKHGRFMYDLIYNRMCMFNLELFAYSKEDLETYLVKNSKTNTYVIKYDYEELGYTSTWFDNRVIEAKSEEEIHTEVLMRWISSDANSLFKLDIIKRLEEMGRRKLERTFIYKRDNPIKYYPKQLTDTFDDVLLSIKGGMVWGIDVSSGGGDYSVVYAIEMDTLEVKFMYRTNNLIVTDFAIIVIDLIRYCKSVNPNMTLVVNPEQNGPGLTLIPLMIKEKDIEPHLFRTIEYYDSKRGIQVVKGWHRAFSSDAYLNYGSNMKKKTNEGVPLRDLLFETHMFEIVDKYPYAVTTADCVSELITLHRAGGKITGKIEAKSGFHDDVIVAALHALNVVLSEYNRAMLIKFFNYTVNVSNIKNMAINSHVDTFKEDRESGDLDDKVDWEIRDAYVSLGSAGVAAYQTIHIFKYFNNIRTEITDAASRSDILNNNQEIADIKNGLKSLSVEEHVLLNKYKMELDRNSAKHSGIPIKSIYEDRRAEEVHYPSHSALDNSPANVNSYNYKKDNKFNTKAKMY